MAVKDTNNLDNWIEGAPFLGRTSNGSLDDWEEGAPIIMLGEPSPADSSSSEPGLLSQPMVTMFM